MNPETYSQIIMFFVRKFLLFLLLLASLSYGSVVIDWRSQFLSYYYGGDYEKAQSILRKVSFDSDRAQIWEERIHLQEDIPDCKQHSTNSGSYRGIALLQIGKIAEAQSQFGEDEFSLLGLARLSSWQNDLARARYYLDRAFIRYPNQPELVLLAGHIAARNEEALYYFRKYLTLETKDQWKRVSAEEAVDFLEKAKGVDLNVPSLASAVERIPSKFEKSRLFIQGRVDQKQSVKLLVDTGAAGLSLKGKGWQPRITSDFALIGLGRNQVTTAKRAVFDDFQTGNFVVKNPVISLSSTLQLSEMDGIAGSVVFSDYVILLPLRSKRDMILLVPSEKDPLSHLKEAGLRLSIRATLPFYFVNQMIVLKGRIQDSPGDMDILLDTGAERSILSTAAAKRYAQIDYRRSLLAIHRPELFGIGGKVDRPMLTRGVDVQIGPLKKTFPEMMAVNLTEISEVMELELDLILGQDFLQGYSLLIDYPHRTITFLR